MGLIETYAYLDYNDPQQAFLPYDERAPEVARHVGDLIEERMPDLKVEHVGSSAIPGCAGKGIIDLLVMYPPGALAAARLALDELGFQRQAGDDPFPEERPLRVGAVRYDGDIFRLHAHVIAAGEREAVEQIYFRDRMAADQTLIDEYIVSKRAALEEIRSGATDAADNIVYNRRKAPFIKRVLAELDPATEPVSKGAQHD